MVNFTDDINLDEIEIDDLTVYDGSAIHTDIDAIQRHSLDVSDADPLPAMGMYMCAKSVINGYRYPTHVCPPLTLRNSNLHRYLWQNIARPFIITIIICGGRRHISAPRAVGQCGSFATDSIDRSREHVAVLPAFTQHSIFTRVSFCVREAQCVSINSIFFFNTFKNTYYKRHKRCIPCAMILYSLKRHKETVTRTILTPLSPWMLRLYLTLTMMYAYTVAV